ncbi:MAG: glycosyltransferase family 2 protein [Candidatus Binataceae bacterium]
MKQDAGASATKPGAIAIVCTVRTDEATLTRWIAYHRHCGVDRFLLFFDYADDPVIERFERDDCVTITRWDAAHWARATTLPANPALDERQIFNTACALTAARRDGIEWLLHIDTDELLYVPGHDLRRYLARNGRSADAMTFQTLEAMPKAACQRHVFEEIRWFKRSRSPIRGAGLAARLLGCGTLFRHGLVKGHAIGKSIVRVAADVGIIGVHKPFATPGHSLPTIVARDAYLLHFDCCTYDDWALKWQRRGDGTAAVAQMRDERKAQLAEFMATSGDLKRRRALYDQLMASPWQYVVLALLRFTRCVPLPSHMFQP